VCAKRCRGVTLLHVDSDAAIDRTGFTFVGSIEKVSEAAFRLIDTASRLISMADKLRCESISPHPAFGVVDVVPFVSLGHKTLEETDLESTGTLDEALDVLAQRVAYEIGVPTYLYAHSASLPPRRRLSALRRGGFSALPTKYTDLNWAPDYTPKADKHRWHAGATAIGRRNLMIAYNIDIDIDHVSDTLKKVVRNLREAKSDISGLRAIAWMHIGYGNAQISMNLYDTHAITLPDLYLRVSTDLAAVGLTALGAELIGLVPAHALIGPSKNLVTDNALTVISQAADIAGLNYHAPFYPKQRVLEYKI